LACLEDKIHSHKIEAVFGECFHRLRQRGIDTAYITGYSSKAIGVYEKLGLCKRKHGFINNLGAK